MNEITVRIALAKNKMTVAGLIRKTGLARETINAVLDGNYEDCKISTLRKIEQALSGIQLIVKFEDTENSE